MAEPFNLQTGAVRMAPKAQYFDLVMFTHRTIVEICKTETVDTGRIRIGTAIPVLINTVFIYPYFSGFRLLLKLA
jgi:hypothetical protein